VGDGVLVYTLLGFQFLNLMSCIFVGIVVLGFLLGRGCLVC